MDEYTTDVFNPGREMAEHEAPEPQPATSSPTPSQKSQTPSRDPDASDWSLLTGRKGLRDRVASLGRTTLQDRLVEKLLQQVIPESEGVMSAGDDVLSRGAPQDKAPNPTERPNFNLTTMSNNFRRFNARIGVVFQFQDRVVRLLTWDHPTCTLSILSIYTFVCLDPYLLAALPPAALLLAVLIPAFLARHPAPPKGTLSSEQSMGYSPRGPPLAPAPTVRPAKELSKDFFHNIRDLQNVMDDFSNLHDSVVALLQPLTNFSDESLSSALFLGLTLAVLLLTITASLIPWRLLFLAAGWFVFLSSHPALSPSLARAHKAHVAPHQRHAAARLRAFAASDVILDSAPETREVEIFELQRASATSAEWEPWLFSPSPYDPLSAPRIAGQRPRGTRFFEDVLPPDGWEWSEKKWALDLWSREWVEERIITGVEVETEGERWVYDMYDEREAQAGLAGDHNGGGVGEGRAGVVDFSRISASMAGSVRGAGRKGKTAKAGAESGGVGDG
ncbi:Pex24p-domain-containing protein [Sodiomyces alkalinus F11]|uniref:Pex24p-domain-containing protein n=1 Tax=Sodiomyces alkalinus (strain CBS 110278 / VKM F-3762 / F11) TaxID=1314773 RepID=A0A3N2PLM1_SODAK|nr:Pex24p-domain-containing protein [Sodiomyces alkalinus F11]ROT35310.1 Pex24p-domain-containing protein [Sodiomyces alkalinus F11]